MEAQIPPTFKCSICSKLTVLGCKSCNSSTYCSPECQNVDWPVHMILCRQFRDVEEPPEGCFRRGILFPVDQENPRFVWVPYTVRYEGDRENQDLDLAEFLADLSGVTTSLTFDNNEVRSRRLGHTIELIQPFLGGSAVNRCISNVTQGNNRSDWHGPVVLVKRELDEISCRYGNVNMIDFRDAVDHFITAFHSPFINQLFCNNLSGQ